MAAHAAPAADTVLVKVAPSDGARGVDGVRRALDAGAPTALPGGWYSFPVSPSTDVHDARADLSGVPAAAAVDGPTVLRPLGVPNDGYFGYQWGLKNTGQDGGTAGIDIGAPAGWDVATRRDRVVVAVVDTGVKTTHPDLTGRIWTNAGEVAGNGVDDDNNGYVDDVNGWDFRNDDASVYDGAADGDHGTHVAGIVAAAQGNSVGIAGVAPNAVVMPLKFMESGVGGYNSDAADAIKYAVNNGATVINGSFGGDTPDTVLCDAVAWAASKGVTFVAAAGNDGRDIGVTGTWPAACTEPSLLTVGAVTNTGGLASFSNYSASLVDLAAPGDKIASTIPSGYGNMQGTSMAAPMVSGIAAVVRGEARATTPTTVRSLLMDTAMPLASLKGTTVSGGMASLARALNAPATTTDPAPAPAAADTTPPAAFALTSPSAGAVITTPTVAFAWQPSQDAGGLAGYRITVDGVQVGETSATTATGFGGDGSHTWYVTAVDAAGNTMASATHSFRVDTLPPSAPAVRSSRLAGKSLTVTWAPASDAGTGVATYAVLVNGAVRATVPAGATRATVPLRPGRNRLVVRATDAAGHSADSAAVDAPVVTVRQISSKAHARARISASTRARVSLSAVRKGKARATTTVTVGRGITVKSLPGSVTRELGRGSSLQVTAAETLTP